MEYVLGLGKKLNVDGESITAMMKLRKLLSKAENCPTKLVFDSGVVPHIIALVGKNTEQKLLVIMIG